MTRLIQSDLGTAQRISDYRKIKSFRNVIVHGYDSIDDATTWNVINSKLPVLQQELATLLKATACSATRRNMQPGSWKIW